MDTRFWGPSGWKLLHLIATAPPRRKTRRLFQLLPYVLPCKYCRASLTDYYAVDPVPVKGFAHWLYRIHNRVNGKLRDQHLLKTPNPSFAKVKAEYDQLYKAPCTQGKMIGWDFLYSVVYTTPCKAVPTSPLPDAPPVLETPELRNRWNTMDREERIKYMSEWWDILADVLPYESWRSAFRTAPYKRPSLDEGHKVVTEWLFQVEKHMCATLRTESKNKSFGGLCRKLSTFQSKCGIQKTLKVKTCRSKQTLRKNRFLKEEK